MMSLSSMGSGGGGNSSASNLSASAPPFTVDRLNPKPNSNPLAHYSDSPYVVEPYSHPSHYVHLSAHRVEPAIDSNDIIGSPVSDGYRFSASASVIPSSSQWSANNSAYGGDAKLPYYNPYVPPLAGDGNQLAENEGSRYNVTLTSGLGVTSQHDYTRNLFDLEYGPRWEDSLRLDDVKQAKRSEFGGNFSSEKQYVGGSHGYEYQPYQGGCGSENRNKFKEDSSFSHKNLNQVSDREVHTGSSTTGYMEDKPCFEQQVGFFHYDSNEPFFTASSSSYPETYPSVVSCAMQKDFPNYQNSQCPYEKCVRPVDTPFPGCVSATESPAAFIRPPPTINWNFGQGASSRKPFGSHIANFESTNLSKLSDIGLIVNSKPKEDAFETSLFKFSKQGNSPNSSISVTEHSGPRHFKDTSDCKIRATLESRMPDVNVTTGFNLTGGNIEVVNSTVETSELIDHHNTVVDSPCWRGAPSSQVSMFDIEVGNSNHVKINFGEHYGLGHGEHPSYLSTIDSNSVFSEKVECNIVNNTECGKTCETLGLDKTPGAICSKTEQMSLDGTTDRVWIPPLTRSKGVELSGSPNMVTKELNLPNNSSSVFDMKVSDTKHLSVEDGSGMIVNEVSEGAAVAVHAAEKVLASPVSQEDASERIAVPNPGLDVPAIVKTIYSLSELLQFHISSDVCSLGDENSEILKHVISSLNSCLSKKGILSQAANKPESKDPVGETSRVLGESSSMGIVSGDIHMECEASDSCTKKDEISPVTLVRDDLHITGDGDMAKAIKKVLEENFHMNEDMHPQALLFKSLWLESEAKLCTISYKARFERLKIQMESNLKAPKAYEDVAEMTSEHCCMSPDPELAPKACGGMFPKPTSQNNSTSGMSRHADGVEASVLAQFNILKCREENPKPINAEKQQQCEMAAGEHADAVMARFNILKCREENARPINTEKQQQCEMAAGEHADTIMARFNILKSREENTKPISKEKQQQCEMVDGEHADAIMARLNILKSREENSKLINMDEERPPVVNDEFTGEKYFAPCIRVQTEDRALNAALQHDFQFSAGSGSGGKFDSYFERAGYESPIEHGISVENDPEIHLVKSGSMTVNETNSSSSDWEHVLKEDFSLKS